MPKFRATTGLFALAVLLPLTQGAAALDILIEGTGDGMEIFQSLSGQFNAQSGTNRVIIPPSIGSGAGIAKVLQGTNPLARSARALSPEETGSGLSAMPVARIPSAIIAHPDIRIAGLSNQQLLAIFSGDITNWRDVGGPDLRIRVHTREEADSTLSALRASMPGWKGLKISNKARAIETSTQDMIKAVIETPGAIGYAPLSQLASHRLTTLAIDGAKPLDASYPSAVTVSLVWRKSGLPLEAAEFLEYVRSRSARQTIANAGATLPRL